jgi:carboxyl-terminal processing protease
MTKRNLIWAGVLLAVAVILLLARTPPRPTTPADSLDTRFRALGETYRLIQDKGYRPSADAELVRGAVGGMAASADEHSSYIPPDMAESFRRRVEGTDRGVGLTIDQGAGQTRVHQVLAGSPAASADLASGDIILTIDGQAAAEVERRLNTGPLGSTVRLEVKRGGEDVREVTLERREFPVESVVGLLRDEGRWSYLVRPDPAIAYIRVREFVRDTAEGVQAAVRQLEAPRGLVLDLRDNPGGQFPVAVEVADLFLREGPIVTLLDKSGRRDPYTARAEGSYPEDLRLVVLINGQTASAAEIVAGALGFNHRAVLVGTRTRGKGDIQSMFRLPEGLGEMNLTTAEFLLGDGRPIDRRSDRPRWGVDPDVEVALSAIDGWWLSQLRVQLEAPRVGGGGSTTRGARARGRPAARSSPLAAAAAILELDSQLRTAVELLEAPERFDAILHPPAASGPQSASAP